jgi:hypothetical protein
MPFSNSVVSGTALARDAIKSPNFVHQETGWTVNQDGSAEFTGLSLNGGSLVVSGAGEGIFLYSSSPPARGTLIFSISATAGTDPYGNTYSKGTISYNSAGFPNIQIRPDLNAILVYG